jgi:Icc-related predicted phosphoesterase
MRLERSLCALDAERVVVVLHYAPIAATVAGEPSEIFPFLGSSRLGDTIDRFKVSLVLHGHAHHGTYAGQTPKGVPVYNCAATVPKEGGRPYALIKV